MVRYQLKIVDVVDESCKPDGGAWRFDWGPAEQVEDSHVMRANRSHGLRWHGAGQRLGYVSWQK